MKFKREWDATCPKVWDRWEKDGVQWWVQDLPPEDDELAVEILEHQFIPDEVIFMAGRILEDSVSLKFMRELWRQFLKERMSLACYTHVNGEKTLAGFNVLIVECPGEEENEKLDKEKAVRHVNDTVYCCKSGVDVFKYYGIDKILYGVGLIVMRQFRGEKLGCKILDAREPLCKHFGIKASSAVYTGPASQKLATRCKFETLAEVTYKHLAESGLNYPMDESKVLKYMAKIYK